MDDAIWDSIDPDPLLVRRDNASKLRYIANQLPGLQGKPYLSETLVRTLHEIALETETAQRDSAKEFASVTAARKALQDLRSALPHIGKEIDLSIKLTREHQRVRRQLGDANRATAKERAHYESTVKEARRQAARAKVAEAELKALREQQADDAR